MSKLTDYDFNKTDPPDAKQIISFLAKIHFDIHAKGESSRDINLIKNYYNKRAILASGLKTFFLSESPNEICKRIKMLLPEKRAVNISVTIKEGIVAKID